MTNSGKPLLCTLGMLVFWTGTCANAIETSGGSPYQGIVERNVFGLKPPPPPPDPEANKPPPPKIFLTGITTILSSKRALMKMTPAPKPGEPAKEQSFTLGEGQRDGDLEVVEIDEKVGKVKVKYYDSIVDLDFENNGVKAAAAPAPGAPPKQAGFVPPPAPAPYTPAAGGGAMPTAARPLRMSSAAGGATSPGAYGGARGPNTYSALPTAPVYGSTPVPTTAGTTAGMVALPAVGTPASTPTPQRNWPPETPMTPEEAAIHEAAYMLQYQQQIKDGKMPAIPGSNPLLPQ